MGTVQRVEIPQYIDDPVQILVWSADELIPVCSMMAVGMALERLTLFLVIAFVVLKYYRRFRDGKPDGVLYHSMYWYGIMPTRGFSVRNPFERVYVS